MIWYYTQENILNEDTREIIFVSDKYASYEKVARLVAGQIEDRSGDYSNNEITFLLMLSVHINPIKCIAYIENIRSYSVELIT